MKFLRGTARFLCTLLLAISGFYTVTSLAIVFFIATGTLGEGSNMWIDTETPSLTQALIVAAVAAGITAIFAYARHKLTPPAGPA